MYGIKIDGEWADLTPGEKVKLSRWNSMFEFETVRGSLVNDFNLPFTPKNDKIFGWFRVRNMKYPNKKYYTEKVVDGYVIERGYIELVDCTEDSYVVVFSQNLSEFFGEYQNVLMSKLPLGGFNTVASPPKKNPNVYGGDAVCWPTVENSAFYGTNVQAGYNGKMNEWIGTSLSVHARVPMMFLWALIEQMRVLFNFSITGSFFGSVIYQKLVIYNCFSLDDTNDVLYANHLPDMTFVDFLIGLRKMFNLAIYFDVNNRIVTIHMCDGLMNLPTYLDWTSKVVPGESRSPERNNRLKLDWELDGNDAVMKGEPLPAGFDAYQSNKTQEGYVREIKTRISTVAMVGGVAKVEQLGVSGRWNQGGAKFGPRVAFWNGLVSGVPRIGVTTTGYRLAWSGANNLVAECWDGFERLIASTSYKVVLANLNAVDLTKIDWHNVYGAKNSVFIKGKEYWILQVDVLLPLDGLSQLYLMEKN